MRSFALGETFDVVTCLFSAIAHLATERDLLHTFERIATHLTTGGVAIIEPWIDPEQFHSGFVQLVSHAAPDRSVARLSYSTVRGHRSRIQYQYLIGVPGRGVRHFAETDVGLLVSRARLIELLARAGLRARFVPRGLTPGRGLLVARKTRRGSSPPRRQTPPRRRGSRSRARTERGAAVGSGPKGSSRPTPPGRE